jgi:hypothetical protein
VATLALLKKIAPRIALVCLPTLVAATAIPLGLYVYGLHLVGTPTPPNFAASPQEQLCVWRTIEPNRPVAVHPLTPWTPFTWLIAEEPIHAMSPGSSVAAVAARQYVHQRRGRMSNLKWHLTTYAVDVWLTRHWSASQLAAEVLPAVMAAHKSRAALECGLTPNPSLQRTAHGRSPVRRR